MKTVQERMREEVRRMQAVEASLKEIPGNVEICRAAAQCVADGVKMLEDQLQWEAEHPAKAAEPAAPAAKTEPPAGPDAMQAPKKGRKKAKKQE